MANYHVNYLTGSNVTGDGSAGNPWATIAFAMTPATSGDTIKVAETGTTQVLDTAAAWSAPEESTTVLNTSVDLTANVAVGDLLIISPKYPGHPEFDGWIIMEARVITSTSINFLNGRPNWADRTNPQFEIRKFTSFVNAGASGDFDDLRSFGSTKGGVTIEGGYDATFTSVTGYTNIFRTGLNQNATSGGVLRITASNGSVPFIKNFRFSKFAEVLNGQFGASQPADNINLYGCNRWTSSSFGSFYNPTSDTAVCTIYASNPGGSLQYSAWSATPNDGRLQATNQLDLYICQGQKTYLIEQANLRNVYAVANTIGANGASFSMSFLIAMNACNIQGEVKAVVGAYLNNGTKPAIFGASNCQINLSDIDVIVSPNYAYSLASIRVLNTALTPNSIKLPSNRNVDYFVTSSNCVQDQMWRVNPNMITATVVESSGKLWNLLGSGEFVTTDTVEYVTGDSSRLIKLSGYGFAALNTAFPIGYAALSNGIGTLQSVTVKAKASGAVNGVSLSNYFFNAQLALASNTVNLTTSYADYTFTIDTNPTSELYRRFLAIDPEILVAYALTADTVPLTATSSVYIWVDSVTFNYV